MHWVASINGMACLVQIYPIHSWDLDPTAAVALQKDLAGQIDVRSPLRHCELIAGADVSYNRFSPLLYAAVVVLRMDGTIVEVQEAVGEATFPYRSGLLTFREAPILLEAFAKLNSEPDAIMLDGQGIAPPRRFGLAAHIGLLLNKPCLGCAKSRLTGKFKEPKSRAGFISPLLDKDGEIIGNVVRTKDNVKPVFVSSGHRIDLPSAVRMVLATCRGYRIPEPTRQAHLHVTALRRRAGG